MIGLLQRVTQASVDVSGERIALIEKGLLVLIGVEQGDGAAQADRLLERLLTYRVFADAEGKMNLNLQQIAGGLLLVPQFTLVADTRKGSRPSFSRGATPAEGKQWFTYLCTQAQHRHPCVQTGQFAADMQVSLINDGPVTFWLHVPPNER